MIRLLISASAGALMLAAGAGAALAQTSADNSAVDAVRSPMELTCGELAELDEDDLRNLLYYAAGYAARDARDAGSGSAASTAEGTIDSDASADAVATAGTAPATPLATTGAENTEVATSAPALDTPASTLSPIGGVDINVEQFLAACGDAPEARLSDILKQQAKN